VLHVAKVIAGKLLYGVVCLFAAVLLVVAGYAHKVVGLVDATENGIAIPGSVIPGSRISGTSPTTGAMNILVMGLESRTNYYGDTLSAGLLTAMHAGSVYGVDNEGVGGQDTDTLILIHIFAGGQKAVGFSIPRDDLVTYPHSTYLGITQGKIDQAYDFAYNESLGQTYGSSDSSDKRYLLANQAGQAFEIATVESVTGVHIDHFIEANLAGFYALAKAFGGIEVCVQPWTAGGDANLSDSASGWNAVADGYNVKKGGDQYLHLAADQALAYVRDRDSLPQVDLDRTHRQQAVIDYVIWRLKNDSAFSDLRILDNLLSSASQYLITDSTFSLLDSATNMRALSGSNVTFDTLPVASELNGMELNGSLQDVNIIDVPYIQQLVRSAFSSAAFSSAASAPAGTSSSSTQGPQSTGAKVIGGQTSASTGATGSPATAPSPAASAGANDGQTGGTVTVAPNAPYGIPCVY
jgi:LCP family protein required for cell wall assembly